MVVEGVEGWADGVEDVSVCFLSAVFGVAQDVELYVEEFVEFQSGLCASQVVVGGGEVYLTDGGVVCHEVVLVDDGLGQGFGQWLGDEAEEVFHEFGNGM